MFAIVRARADVDDVVDATNDIPVWNGSETMEWPNE